MISNLLWVYYLLRFWYSEFLPEESFEVYASVGTMIFSSPWVPISRAVSLTYSTTDAKPRNTWLNQKRLTGNKYWSFEGEHLFRIGWTESRYIADERGHKIQAFKDKCCPKLSQVALPGLWLVLSPGSKTAKQQNGGGGGSRTRVSLVFTRGIYMFSFFFIVVLKAWRSTLFNFHVFKNTTQMRRQTFELCLLVVASSL